MLLRPVYGAGVERFAGFFLLSWGWKRAILSFCVGAFSALAMAPFNTFFILFFTFPILLWLMEATCADPASRWFDRVFKSFLTGWCFGFGYFLAGLWWIGNAFLVEAGQFGWMLPLAVILLPAFLAIFHGVGTVIAAYLWRDDWRRPLALAAGLGLGEYLRGQVLTGFPWNTLGYGALTHELIMQKSALLGVYGVTVLAIMVFSAPGLIALRYGTRQVPVRLFWGFCVLLVAADIGYGWTRLRNSGQEMAPGVSLRLVQPAIDQAAKWSPETQQANMQLLLDLSDGQNPDNGQRLMDTTLLIWPESAFPFVLTRRPDALSAIAQMLPPGTQLVSGALRPEPAMPGEGREPVYNSVFTIDHEGGITGAADKVHLVPFGEYLPFQKWAEATGLEQLTHLRGGFTAGNRRMLLDGGQAGKFLPLICYEIIFSGNIVTGSERPGWLLNVTNDAWFGMTPGPYQHWQQAVIRGVEEGLPVVRVANNGISSVSDANGRIVERIALGMRAIADSPLPLPLPPTLYSKLGNWLFGMIVFVIILVAAFPVSLYNTTRH
jgi:apolipoprotein N-acyltransferase